MLANAFKYLCFTSLYYIVWFSCLWLGIKNQPYLALLFSILISSIQFVLFINKNNMRPLLKWVFILSSIGFLMDTMFVINHLFIFKGNAWHTYLAPPWILALWINFSVLCFFLYNTLKKYLRYLPMVAFLGFPVAYAGGAQFGAVIFPSYSKAMLSLAMIWGIIFPMTFIFLKKTCPPFTCDRSYNDE